MVFGGQQRGPLRVDGALPDFDLIHLIHRLRQEMEAEAGVTESGDLAFGSE